MKVLIKSIYHGNYADYSIFKFLDINNVRKVQTTHCTQEKIMMIGMLLLGNISQIANCNTLTGFFKIISRVNVI